MVLLSHLFISARDTWVLLGENTENHTITPLHLTSITCVYMNICVSECDITFPRDFRCIAIFQVTLRIVSITGWAFHRPFEWTRSTHTYNQNMIEGHTRRVDITSIFIIWYLAYMGIGGVGEAGGNVSDTAVPAVSS